LEKRWKMAKLLFEFDSKVEGDVDTNIVRVYEDGTYTAERLRNKGCPSYWHIEGDSLYFKHDKNNKWMLSESGNTFTKPFLRMMHQVVDNVLLGEEVV
jgi:hypothetical protein